MTRDVLGDFDAADVVDVQDGARIRALSDAARRWRDGAAARPGRARARGAAAAAVLIFGGTASAAVWMWRRPPAAAKLAIAERAPVVAPSAGSARGSALATPAPETADALPAPAVAAPRASAVHTRATATSATALLRQASDARRAGDAERAIVLYRRLKREFGASPEAVLSTVPLGRLLLQAGSARAALAEFDRYLAAAPSGTLVPEALYGRARALGELGDRSGERSAWQRLTAEFPGSAYAPLGRRRLAE
jgi:TolA-binding protein